MDFYFTVGEAEYSAQLSVRKAENNGGNEVLLNREDTEALFKDYHLVVLDDGVIHLLADALSLQLRDWDREMLGDPPEKEEARNNVCQLQKMLLDLTDGESAGGTKIVSKRCPRCMRALTKSDNPEYVYQCLDCDEDFYEFEAIEN